MEQNNPLRSVFDDVADLYDTARPGYPEQLITDILIVSNIPPDGRILEVGCGTGQATRFFARRGFSMLCLELGEKMAALAAKNLRQYPDVAIQNIAFEAWDLQPKFFDLVFSAQAFDWIPPEIGYPKAAEALKESGWIVLFRNDIQDIGAELSQALAEMRQSILAPAAKQTGNVPYDALVTKAEGHIQASGLFEDVISRRYPWSMQYSTETYIQLVSTYSTFRYLGEETQGKLVAGIREVIERFGGIVPVRYVAALSMAKVKR